MSKPPKSTPKPGQASGPPRIESIRIQNYRVLKDVESKNVLPITVLFSPRPPQFIGIEEPESFLHPRLLDPLAEECRAASERSQLLITSHSPFFIGGMKPEEVRILYRDGSGFTQSRLTSEIPGIQRFLDAGARLGELWLENQFGVGDPLEDARTPRTGRKSSS